MLISCDWILLWLFEIQMMLLAIATHLSSDVLLRHMPDITVSLCDI